MSHWTIKPLYLGHITGYKVNNTPDLDPDLIINKPFLAFLLQKDGRNILVDSGISEKFIVDGKGWGGLPAWGGRQYLLDALEKENITPSDIEIVIYTHLHNDHAANCDLFSNADKIIFQKDEWYNLLDPLPVEELRRDYDPATIEELRAMKNVFKIDGDFDLEEGIKLFKTPGHTKGSQSVAVTTAKGVQVIVGDHFHINAQAFPAQTEMMDMEGKLHKITPAPKLFELCIPSKIVYDYYAYYESTYRIRAMASKYEPEFIICGHDPSILVNGV